MSDHHNLKAMIEDPEQFEQQVNAYAVSMLEDLKEHVALTLDPHNLAEAGFENLKRQEIDADVYQALLLPYVKKHFLTSFAESVVGWQRDRMVAHYSEAVLRLGEQYEFVIDQHGQSTIEVVVLDDDKEIDEGQLAYRYNDRLMKEPWLIGTVLDAIDECVQRRMLES